MTHNIITTTGRTTEGSYFLIYTDDKHDPHYGIFNSIEARDNFAISVITGKPLAGRMMH